LSARRFPTGETAAAIIVGTLLAMPNLTWLALACRVFGLSANFVPEQGVVNLPAGASIFLAGPGLTIVALALLLARVSPWSRESAVPSRPLEATSSPPSR
jgi:hypothetical protein